MNRFRTTLVLLLLCAAPMRADVTVVQTMSIEGAMTAMMGGVTPRMVTRIKDQVSRTDVDVMDQTVATITNLATRQLIVLNGADKTAQIFGAGSPAFPAGQAPPMPKVDVTSKPTGQSRVIEGAQCQEHAFTMKVNLAEMGASGQMPAEASAAMKDVRLSVSGSVWVATEGPGVAEYMAFYKAAADANLAAAVTGMPPGQSGGLESLMNAASAAPGLPYLTEMIMTFEGTGKVVDMMKVMGPMKLTHRVTSVSTDAVPNDLFVVPEGYQVVKP